jgi:hypothetical protein
VQKNCLTSENIRDVMYVFDYEKTRIDFAKFAYDFAYDPENYDEVNAAFHADSSIDVLKKYIETKK